MKPYIDEEGIKDNVGINYTQNDVDGKIYTVHDQLLTLGYWYNDKVLKDAGATTPDTWKNWNDLKEQWKKYVPQAEMCMHMVPVRDLQDALTQSSVCPKMEENRRRASDRRSNRIQRV